MRRETGELMGEHMGEMGRRCGTCLGSEASRTVPAGSRA